MSLRSVAESKRSLAPKKEKSFLEIIEQELEKISQKKKMSHAELVDARANIMILISSAQQLLQDPLLFREAWVRLEIANKYAFKIRDKLIQTKEKDQHPIFNSGFFHKAAAKSYRIYYIATSERQLSNPPFDREEAFAQAKKILEREVSDLQKILVGAKLNLDEKVDLTKPQNIAIFALKIAVGFARQVAFDNERLKELSDLMVKLILPAARQLFLSQPGMSKELPKFRQDYANEFAKIQKQRQRKSARGFDQIVEAVRQLNADITPRHFSPEDSKSMQLEPSRVASGLKAS